MLLHKTEEYVQRIRDEESRLRQLRELGRAAALPRLRRRYGKVSKQHGW